MKNRIIATCMSLIIMLSMMPLSAIAETEPVENSVEFKPTDLVGTGSVKVLNADEFNTIFAIDPTRIEIVSDYVFSINKATSENKQTAIDVSYDFVIGSDVETYVISTTGELTYYKMSSGLELYEGCLEGTADINGQEYAVLVGLMLNSKSKTPSATVTLTPADTLKGSSGTSFVIGRSGVTKENAPELFREEERVVSNDATKSVDEKSTDALPSNYARYFTFPVNLSAPLDTTLRGITMYGYKYPASNKVAVVARSHTNYVNRYYEEHYDFAVSSVSYSRIGVRLTTDAAHLDGLKLMGVGQQPDVYVNSVMLAIVDDALALMPFGSETFKATLSSFNANFLKHEEIDLNYAQFSYGLMDIASFDSTEHGEGVPVIFQLDGVVGEIAYVRSYVTMKYRTFVYDEYADEGYWFYNEVQENCATTHKIPIN